MRTTEIMQNTCVYTFDGIRCTYFSNRGCCWRYYPCTLLYTTRLQWGDMCILICFCSKLTLSSCFLLWHVLVTRSTGLGDASRALYQSSRTVRIQFPYAHDDVMTITHSLYYWPFVRIIHWIPSQLPVMRNLHVFFVNIKKLLNKLSSFMTFEIPWGSCNVILMAVGNPPENSRRLTIFPLFNIIVIVCLQNKSFCKQWIQTYQ